MALQEKALLDTIYLRQHIPFADELDLDNIQKDKLMSLSELFPAIVRKRLEAMLA